LAAGVVRQELNALRITLNDEVFYQSDSYEKRRETSELVELYLFSRRVPGVEYYYTRITYDYKSVSVLSALYGIYLTLFVLVLLVVSLL
jgi:hypothetical protein